jgi:D-glycero-D-manno-heptose 1,7-bisphosphate phosphatase
VTALARAVFLDRDGVLVRARVVDGRPYAIRGVEELELEDGAREACATLRAAGFLLVAVTNQPEVARGTLAREDVDAMHQRLAELLPLDDVRLCPHDDADGCACRKPKPGMLLDAAREHGIDLRQSFLVGDRWRDVGAGRAAGCTCVFLDREYSESMPERPDTTVRELGEAVAWILSRSDR